ncbi:hypothetical protein JKY79_03300 [Candidatus Babeliales bacterium]|nr:hypothetical protein [Candidatus Babeliales bacterium]
MKKYLITFVLFFSISPCLQMLHADELVDDLETIINTDTSNTEVKASWTDYANYATILPSLALNKIDAIITKYPKAIFATSSTLALAIAIKTNRLDKFLYALVLLAYPLHQSATVLNKKYSVIENQEATEEN